MSATIPAPVLDAMREYGPHELGGDGYPPAWHRLPGEQEGVKHAVEGGAS